MTTPTPPPVRQPRRLWPWILLGVVCAPFVLLGAAAVSYLTLNRDAAALRREVMRATDAEWNTRVQFSVGRASFATARGCLSVVQNDKVDEARQALASVKSASVGVYELRGRDRDWSRGDLANRTDAAMRDRGWTRAVGVLDCRHAVLVYVPENTDEVDEICLAVLDGRQLVVVSAELRPEQLVELVERHAGEKLRIREKLRFAAN